jgi:hypothetical protein
VGVVEGFLRASARFCRVVLAASVGNIYFSLGESSVVDALLSTVAIGDASPALLLAIAGVFAPASSFYASSSALFNSTS